MIELFFATMHNFVSDYMVSMKLRASSNTARGVEGQRTVVPDPVRLVKRWHAASAAHASGHAAAPQCSPSRNSCCRMAETKGQAICCIISAGKGCCQTATKHAPEGCTSALGDSVAGPGVALGQSKLTAGLASASVYAYKLLHLALM